MTEKEIKTIELIINNKQALQKLDELEKKRDELLIKKQNALDAGDADAYNLYTKEIRKVNKEIERVQARAKTLSQALRNLDNSAPNQLQRTLRELQRELNSGKVQRGSMEWNTLTKAIRETKMAMASVNKEIESVKFGDKLSAWGQKWAGLIMNVQSFIQTASGIKHILQETTAEFAQMEEAKAQVRKYTGLDAKDVDDLNESLKAMDTRTSREQLNALAGDAGKLGITSKAQILEFVEAADKINVALGDDLGEGAVKNVGKLAMLFGEDQRLGLKGAMLSTASVINELSQNSSASAGYLEEFTARLSGVGKMARLTQAQIMGFAAVLDESMQEDATSATAFSQLITKMYQEPAKFAALAGQDVKEFSRLLKEDANGALIAFLGNMKAQGGFDKLAPMFQQMGLDGTRATAVLSSVADKLGNVEKMQRMANQAYEEAVSVNNEYDVQNNTVQAGLDKAKKAMLDMRVELGEKLMPVASKMVNFTTLFLKTLSTLITFFWKNKNSIIAAATAFGLYTLAVNGSIIVDKAKVIWTNHIKVAMQKLYDVLSKNPWAAIVTIVAAMVGHFMDANRQMSQMEKSQKRLTEIGKEASESLMSEERQLQRLISIAKDENRSKAEREAAIRKLNEISPEYLGNLTLETINTDKAAAATERYVKAIRLKKKIELGEEELADLRRGQAQARNTKMGAGTNIINQSGIGLQLLYSDFTRLLARNHIYLGGLHSDFRDTFNNYGETLAKSYEPAIAAVEQQIEQWSDELQKLATETAANAETQITTQSTNIPVQTNKNNNHTSDKDKKLREERERLEKEALARKIDETIQYQKGLTSRRDYDKKLLAIEQDMIIKQRDLYQQGSDEWNELEEKRLDMVQRVRDQRAQWSMQNIARKEEEANAAAQREYLQGTLSEEQYQSRLDEIKLSHLRKRADYYDEIGDTEKAKEYTKQADAEDLRLQLQRRKDYLQKAKAMQDKYFQKSLDEREQDELRLLDELVSAGVIAEEKKQEFIKQIQDKYKKLRKDEKDAKDKEEDKKIENPLGDATGIASDFNDIFKKLESLNAKLRDGEETWKDYAAVAVSALAFVSTALSSVSQLFSAQQQEEENAVTQRYDTEIKKVGENSTKGKKLEEEKQKELAKVKNKYRKKQMSMEIAQAVASTAMAAINAYASASKVSWLLGPIAAAMAVAAGGIQIAAIKKQHAAESSGYYEGGFTGGSDYRKKAGIVHQGEFVASHLAVQNPNVLPLLKLIDHAQRNNTIASLSASDVSRAIAAPQATAGHTAATASSPTLQILDATSERTVEAIDRLNDNLEAGIRASVSITGEDGLERQWNRYNKMKNRK